LSFVGFQQVCVAVAFIQNFIKGYTYNVSIVGCQKNIQISQVSGLSSRYTPGDVFTCSTASNYGFKQSYKWTDSNGVIVSNTSTMMLTGEGSFNLTCTITDQRPECHILNASINGTVYGKYCS